MEKTNTITKVTNSNTDWLVKPILAAGAALIVGSAVAGCSHGNAAPIAAGSNNNAAAGGENTDANSGSHAAQTGGGDQKKVCDALVGSIGFEQFHEDDPNPNGLHHSREGYTSLFQPGGTQYSRFFHRNAEALKIAIDAYGKTHSKEIHRRVKDFCGPHFDSAVEHLTESIKQLDSHYTPDWSL